MVNPWIRIPVRTLIAPQINKEPGRFRRRVVSVPKLARGRGVPWVDPSRANPSDSLSGSGRRLRNSISTDTSTRRGDKVMRSFGFCQRCLDMEAA